MEILLVIIIVIFYFLFKFYTPTFKGVIGESKVSRKLAKLPGKEFKVYNDVLIRSSSGTNQIDHIVISKYGIFVIETKNYSGWIHGNENSEYWTQTIYNNKSTFRNPVKQNWAHIYALKEILTDFKQVAYHPIIVFSGSAELKNIYSKVPVIYHHQLIPTIMDQGRLQNLSIEKADQIASKLNEVIIQDKQAKKEHIHQVQNHAFERKKKEKTFTCPKCNGMLFVRDGPYGKFYGCSNYPMCKYKRKIKE